MGNPDHLPCDKCPETCCGITTPFSSEDIKQIKRKSKKLLRGKNVVAGYVPGTFVVLKKGMALDDLDKHLHGQSCLFLTKGRCEIYDIRPQICRDYGVKPYAVCPFKGMENPPADQASVNKLVADAQERGAQYIQDMFAEKTRGNNFARKVEAVPATAIGVLSNECNNTFVNK